MGCIFIGFGYGVIQPIAYDKTTRTAIPEKVTLALAFVMAMNYLAILLCPFIIDFFQSILHVKSQQFAFIFNLCIALVATIWAYVKREANISMVVSKTFSGLNMNALKYLLPLWMSPLTGASFRCVFAAVAFWVIGWFMKPEVSTTKDKVWLFLLGAIGIYGFMFL